MGVSRPCTMTLPWPHSRCVPVLAGGAPPWCWLTLCALPAQVLNEDKEVSVPANQVFGGLHWMRLVGSGAEGIMVANNVLFQPRQTAPGGVETEFGFVRWAVPGSRGDPAQFTPFLSGHSILRAAATMFDLDGDGALNVAEYNSFTEAMFGLSALKDYGDADSDAAADAEDAKVTAKDLKEMARGAGYDIEEGQALPLGAIPTLWKIRAAIRGKKTDQPPQERLQWELANVLVVRLGRGLKREHQVSTYEGRPEVGGGSWMVVAMRVPQRGV